jgi:hypothetical protein
MNETLRKPQKYQQNRMSDENNGCVTLSGGRTNLGSGPPGVPAENDVNTYVNASNRPLEGRIVCNQ